MEATVLRQGCASVFVRSVDGDIRLEGADVAKPAPGRPPENGGIHYPGEWQGRRVAMDDVLQLQYTPQGRRDMLCFCAPDEDDLLPDVYCVAAEWPMTAAMSCSPWGSKANINKQRKPRPSSAGKARLNGWHPSRSAGAGRRPQPHPVPPAQQGQAPADNASRARHPQDRRGS